jgi:hypothetical protein
VFLTSADPKKENVSKKTLESALKSGWEDIARESPTKNAVATLFAWKTKSKPAMKPFLNAGITETFAMTTTNVPLMSAILLLVVFTLQKVVTIITCAPKTLAIQKLDALTLLLAVMMEFLVLWMHATQKMENVKMFQITQNVQPLINALLGTVLEKAANFTRMTPARNNLQLAINANQIHAKLHLVKFKTISPSNASWKIRTVMTKRNVPQTLVTLQPEDASTPELLIQLIVQQTLRSATTPWTALTGELLRISHANAK